MMQIDLTNPQGRYGGSAQAVAGVLKAWGEAERERRDVASMEAFLENMSQGSDFNTAVTAVMAQRDTPQYGGGLGGLVQRTGSRFMPPSKFIERLANVSMQTGVPLSDLERRKAEAGIASSEATAQYRTKQAEVAELKQINDAIYNIWLSAEPGQARTDQLKPWLAALNNFTKRLQTAPATEEVAPPQPGAMPRRRPVEPVEPIAQYAPERLLPQETPRPTAVGEAGRTAASRAPAGTQYNVGDVIEARGKRWKVVGYDTDGMPLVDEVR